MFIYGVVKRYLDYTLFFFFFLLRPLPVTYGSSQARGQIETAAAGLHHSQGNTGSQQHLQPTPQLVATMDP